MYFSRITLRPDAGESLEFWRGAASENQAHAQIWRLFSDGPERKRDFIYRQESFARGRPGFLTVSSRPPRDDLAIWQTEHKPYRPKLSTGQRLGFRVRVNPVVSRRDESGRQHRHDVVMDAKKQLQDKGVPQQDWPSQAGLAQKAGVEWLTARQQQHGFIINPEVVLAEAYHQIRFPRKGRLVSLSSLEISGTIKVTEPDPFVEMLYQGLGPAKGYGFGMLLVRPI